MPRGRHRHAPPLHRLLAPAVIAAAALTCTGGALLVGGGGSTAWVLRGLCVGAAAAAVTGAALMRRWDRAAGQRVAEVKAGRATLEWRAEERQAELETDLDEAREIRVKLEDVLRRRRAELEKLRNEHAALLRRYATAETERATALEGRRQLAIAASEPARELTADPADHRRASGAPTPLTYLQAGEALRHLTRSRLRQQAAAQQTRRRAEAQAEQRAVALRAAQAESRRLAEGEEGFDFFEAQADPDATVQPGGADAAAATEAPGAAPGVSGASAAPEEREEPGEATASERPGAFPAAEPAATASPAAPAEPAATAEPAASVEPAEPAEPAQEPGAAQAPPRRAPQGPRAPQARGEGVQRPQAARPRPLGERESAERDAGEEPDLPHASGRRRPRVAGKVIDLAEHGENGENAPAADEPSPERRRRIS